MLNHPVFLVNKDEPGHVYHGQARFRYLLIAPDVLALTSIFDVEILQSQQIHPCGLIYRADFFAGIDPPPGWMYCLYFCKIEKFLVGRLEAMAFQEQVADFLNSDLLRGSSIDRWELLFQQLISAATNQRLVIVIDEFQYIGKGNP